MKSKTKLAAILLSIALTTACTPSENPDNQSAETEKTTSADTEETVSSPAEVKTADEAEPKIFAVIHKAGDPVETNGPDEYGIDWDTVLAEGFGEDFEYSDIVITGKPTKKEDLKDRWDIWEGREEWKENPSAQNVIKELNIPGFKDIYDSAECMVSVITYSPYDTAVMDIRTGKTHRSIITSHKEGENLSGVGYFMETGISFEGFYNTLLDVMTPEFANSLINGGRFYRYGDYLYARISDRGGDMSVVHREYELAQKNDTEIVIRTVFYCTDGSDLTFDPEKKDEYEKDFAENRFVLTENGWRADYFTLDRSKAAS